ncbi:MAG TPA: tyrosine-type recombinase/integrase, partial [Alphaproteobacteria bacterium]|nr:tyrosine-type recombinase/integrase [Alphaproteobacteria bacterium]
VTLADVLEGYLRDRQLKSRSAADVRGHVDRTFAKWKDRPVVEISRDKVARRFRELSTTAPIQANQAFRCLRALLNYARARYRTPDDAPILAENPVQVLSDMRAWNRQRARNTYVPLDKIGKWWAAVQDRRADPSLTAVGRTGGDLVAFLALTGLRKGEATGLRWSDIDLDDASLRLEDTKNGETIRLPLSSPAVTLLSARDTDAKGEFVFPGRGGDGRIHDARPTLDKIAEATGIAVTPHDLRRTFRAVAGAVGIELWKAKALMNHKQRADVTLGHYTDLEDVRYLRPEAEKIADHLEEQAAIARAANVTTLERERAEAADA